MEMADGYPFYVAETGIVEAGTDNGSAKRTVKLKSMLTKEAYRAWELYQAGVFREIYFVNGPYPVAVIIMEADSVGEAKKALASLPLVKEGYIDFDVIQLSPYPGFARLFRDNI